MRNVQRLQTPADLPDDSAQIEDMEVLEDSEVMDILESGTVRENHDSLAGILYSAATATVFWIVVTVAVFIAL